MNLGIKRCCRTALRRKLVKPVRQRKAVEVRCGGELECIDPASAVMLFLLDKNPPTTSKSRRAPGQAAASNNGSKTFVRHEVSATVIAAFTFLLRA